MHQNKGALLLTGKDGKTVSYSKDQIMQKKVIMVTLGELTSCPKHQIAKAFGYSTRKSYYDIRKDVLNGNVEDLLPQKTGPKKTSKRTKEMEILVIKMRFETDKNMYEMAEELNRLGFDCSSRVVANILNDYGL